MRFYVNDATLRSDRSHLAAIGSMELWRGRELMRVDAATHCRRARCVDAFQGCSLFASSPMCVAMRRARETSRGKVVRMPLCRREIFVFPAAATSLLQRGAARVQLARDDGRGKLVQACAGATWRGAPAAVAIERNARTG